MSAEARLWEMVEAAAVKVTDAVTGRFENKRLVEELRAQLSSNELAPHVRALTMDELASRLADGFVRRRSPKAGGASGLFNPYAVLRLGDGLRIWMARAGSADLIEWARLSQKNADRVRIANEHKQVYVASRVDALNAKPGWNLEKVEREVFGWSHHDLTADDFDGDPGDDE